MSTENDERSLADKAPEETAAEEPRDVTVKPAPEGFDFAAFVSGIRPTRRAVRVYARGDLAAERDVLRAEIQAAQDQQAKAAEIKRLRDSLAAVTREMNADGAVIDIVLEGRSSETVTKLHEALEKDIPGEDRQAERDLHMVAAQVVAPEGVTAELLGQIRAVSEPQWQQLIFAAAEASTTSGVVTPDFSRGRSATTRK
ncbi:MAG: hypothetical protein ACTHXF_08950 [Brevibacterium yomogidense]